MPGKASSLDHSLPDHIDQQKTELSICCLAMYVNCNLPGEMWSISPDFPITLSKNYSEINFNKGINTGFPFSAVYETFADVLSLFTACPGAEVT
jgi:hypothetical protein